MKGRILHYRQGVHTQYGNHMLIAVEGVCSREEATKLVGKKVTWTSPAGKAITGEVRSAHGNKGVVRVLFSLGMPGQSIGSQVVVA